MAVKTNGRGGKRMQSSHAVFDREETYELEEAVNLLQSMPKAGFDETVELHMRLGVDPKQADQQVRGAVSLPKGLGKDVTVIAFAEGEKADAAREAGADEVGSEDLAEKIEGGWMDFDIAIASPDMMRHVGRLGRVLGPHGKMPSPKSGTVTDDVAGAVREFKSGKVEYRVDSGGNIHAPVGKRSFENDDLVANARHLIDTIIAARPPATKGRFVLRTTLCSTMSPGIKVRAGIR